MVVQFNFRGLRVVIEDAIGNFTPHHQLFKQIGAGLQADDQVVLRQQRPVFGNLNRVLFIPDFQKDQVGIFLTIIISRFESKPIPPERGKKKRLSGRGYIS